MADATQLEILLNGACGWNDWRKENPEVRIDLHGADLAYGLMANFRCANLAEADLREAILQFGVSTNAPNGHAPILLREVLHAFCSTLHEANEVWRAATRGVV